MTIRQQQAQDEAEERKARIKAILIAAGVLPLLLATVIAIKYLPALARQMHPPPRSGVAAIELVDNSGSYAANHKLACEQADSLNDVLYKLLNPLQFCLLRFASIPVEIGSGVLEPVQVHKNLKDFYLHVRTDLTPGSFLAPAIAHGVELSGDRANTLILAVGTDSFEDVPQTINLLKSLARTHRLIVLFFGVPIHNRIHDPQHDHRGVIRTQLEPILHDDLYIATGKSDLADATDRWLPARLRAAGMAGL